MLPIHQVCIQVSSNLPQERNNGLGRDFTPATKVLVSKQSFSNITNLIALLRTTDETPLLLFRASVLCGLPHSCVQVLAVLCPE